MEAEASARRLLPQLSSLGTRSHRAVVDVCDEALAMIAEHADCPDAHQARDVQGGLVVPGIYLSISTFRCFRVVSGTVATVHYGLPRMITTLFAAAVFAKTAQETPILAFRDGAFMIKTGTAVTKVRLQAPAPAKTEDQVIFRKNSNFAVWDGRGLSIRHKNRTKSSRLPDIALTPKLFTKEQIIETRELIVEGVRQKEASALSGARRVGSEAFFLVRWSDANGKTWLEALVKVDLDSENPTPQLVGKFDGFSLAKKPIDDCLFTIGDNLCVLTRADGSWNLAKYNLTEKAFSAYVQGLDLVSYSPISKQLGIFVEKASDGAYVVGRVDLATGSRRNLLESRLKPTILDGERPSIAILENKLIHNLESGVQTPIPSGAKAIRTKKGVIVYWPSGVPKKAVLLDPERWTQLAKWDVNLSMPVKAIQHAPVVVKKKTPNVAPKPRSAQDKSDKPKKKAAKAPAPEVRVTTKKAVKTPRHTVPAKSGSKAVLGRDQR